jgi:hypothetical protein
VFLDHFEPSYRLFFRPLASVIRENENNMRLEFATVPINRPEED